MNYKEYFRATNSAICASVTPVTTLTPEEKV